VPQILSAYSNTGNAPPIFGGSTRIAGFEVPSEPRASIWRNTLLWVAYAHKVRARSRTTFVYPTAPVVAAPLTVQHTTQVGAGIIPTFSPANTAGFDTFVQVPGAVVEVHNNGTQAETVIIIAVSACNQGYLHNYSQVIAPGGRGTIGPFDSHYISNPGNIVTIDYSVYQQGVTVAVLAP
jgi:hypothetical protein